MTPAQLKLARWLAGSDAWRVWCEEHSGEANAIRWVPYPSVPGQMVPDITSPLMVGPLIEMLRASGVNSFCRDGYAHRFVTEGHLHDEDSATDAEALCRLLREVTT